MRNTHLQHGPKTIRLCPLIVPDQLTTLNVGYQNGRPSQALSPAKTEETLVSLTLNIPLFEGFARTYKVRGAQTLVEQRQAELDAAQQKTLMEVVKAHSDATAALQNLGASKTLFDTA